MPSLFTHDHIHRILADVHFVVQHPFCFISPPCAIPSTSFSVWEVENGLHLQKDRSDEEDKHGLRGDGQGTAWTILTNMA